MRISTQNIACSQRQMNTCHTSFSYILWAVRERERQRQRETDRDRQTDRDKGLCFKQHRSPYLQGGSTPCPGRPAHHPMEGEGVAGRKYACCLNGWMIRNLGLIRSRHVACSRGQADSRRLFCCRLVRSLHCRHRCVPKEIETQRNRKDCCLCDCLAGRLIDCIALLVFSFISVNGWTDGRTGQTDRLTYWFVDWLIDC